MNKKGIVRMQVTLSKFESINFERAAKAAGYDGVRDWAKFLLHQAATAANMKTFDAESSNSQEKK